MQVIGKIGLCIPEITDSLDFEMIDGMFTQAQALGYDLLLFTGVYNARERLNIIIYKKEGILLCRLV